MALPTTGPLKLSDVNVELGRSPTAQISLGEQDVRGLFDRAAGSIAFSQGRGKANSFAFNIVSNVTNANLRTLALNAGWNGTSAVVATIDPGVTISGNTAGNSTAAMTINGSFPEGVELINNGIIVGRGGNGGVGGSSDAQFSSSFTTTNGTNGSAGGRALLVQVSVSIRNNGEIRGGGGGGAGGTSAAARLNCMGGFGTCGGNAFAVSGAGGGGGRSSLTNSSGGSRGTATSSNSSGRANGGAGGAGTLSGAGGRGLRASRNGCSEMERPCNPLGGTLRLIGGHAGSGGNWGASGGNAAAASVTLNPCCGTPHSLGTPRSGGAAGQAVNGNSNITWLATGTRSGPIV